MAGVVAPWRLLLLPSGNTLSQAHPIHNTQDDLFDLFDDPNRPPSAASAGRAEPDDFRQASGDRPVNRPVVSPTLHEKSFKKHMVMFAQKTARMRKHWQKTHEAERSPSPRRKLPCVPANSSGSACKISSLGRLKNLIAPTRLRDFFRFNGRNKSS